MSKLDYPFDINKESLDAICKCKSFSSSFFKVGDLSYFIQQKYFVIAKYCLSFKECHVNSFDPINSSMDEQNEEIATLIAKKPDFIVNEEIVINSIISHFDCLESLLNHIEFELDVSYQKGKPLFIVSEKGSRKSIKITLKNTKIKSIFRLLNKTKFLLKKTLKFKKLSKF